MAIIISEAYEIITYILLGMVLYQPLRNCHVRIEELSRQAKWHECIIHKHGLIRSQVIVAEQICPETCLTCQVQISPVAVREQCQPLRRKNDRCDPTRKEIQHMHQCKRFSPINTRKRGEEKGGRAENRAEARCIGDARRGKDMIILGNFPEKGDLTERVPTSFSLAYPTSFLP